MNNRVNFKVVFLVYFICSFSIIAQTPFSELFTYDFGGLEEKGISEQVEIIQDAGFKGITIFEPGNTNDATATVTFLEQWYELLENNPDFNISCFYYRHRYNGSWTPGTIWKKVMDKLAEREIPLLVIIKEEKGYKGSVSFEMALNQYEKLNNYGKKIGLPVVIYPHSDTYLESAEEALPYVEAINDDNFSLSFHLCHELRAGNKDRIDKVIKKIAPHLSIVTMNGADSEDIYTILPLTDGDYNTESILPTLYEVGYTGPIGIHTHKIPGPAIDHLSASYDLLNERIEKLQGADFITSDANVVIGDTFLKAGEGVLSFDVGATSFLSLKLYTSSGRLLYQTSEPIQNRTDFSLNLDELGIVSGNYILEFETNMVKKAFRVAK